MKKSIILISFFICLMITNTALAVIGVGLRGGMNKFVDDPPGDNPMVGAQVKVDLPMTSFTAEVSTEYFKKEYEEEFYYPELDEPLVSETTFNHLCLNGTMKYNLNLLPMSPVTPYMGVGGGLHLLFYEFNYNGETVYLPDNIEVENEEDLAKFGFHLLAGTNISIPAVPFDVFVEGKYNAIFMEDDENRSKKYTSVYGGINVGF